MDKNHWLRTKELLADLVECPPEELTTRLDTICGADTALRAELERLLALNTEADGFFDALGHDLGQSDSVPDHIGAYRIDGEIGRGGMATVYLGQRDDGQFKQEVAIKVMRHGVDPRLLARFQDERRILARLKHPGIAYLMDGGSLPDGRPYFVMEHVRGEPITTYADRKRLDIPARLRLFAEVCAAVAHAHRNLVIHRDLKPGNVLVHENDQGRPVAKLLDFGIARMLADSIDEEPATASVQSGPAPVNTTPHTEYGQRILTPRYAAPEQLRGEPVTVAADVHALGVLLAVLLVGEHPFAPPGTSAADMEQHILDGKPIPPSALAGQTTTEAPRLRSLTARTFARALRGDLDAIVMHAIAHDPEQRYDSAATLAEDLRRHQQHLPVFARPTSIGYRGRTFVRRHRLGVAMGLLALLATATFATIHVQRITHERDLARTEAAKAQQVSKLLADMLESADPRQARGEEISVREVLDKASEKIQSELTDQPEVRARMGSIIGSTYISLGKYAQAETALNRALQTQREQLVPGHPETLDTLQAMAALAMRREQNGQAETLLREVLAQRQKQARPDLLLVTSTQNDLGWALGRQGKYDEAVTLLRAALATTMAIPDVDPEALMSVRNNLAVQLVRTGQFEEAEKYYRQILARQRELLGPAHPYLATTLHNLAMLLGRQQRLAEAESLLRESIAMRRTLFGDKHPSVALSMVQIANNLTKQERYDEAEPLYLKVLAMRRASLKPDHPHIATNLNSLAGMYSQQHNYAKAEPLYHEAIAICRKSVGAEHPWTSDMLGNLGLMYLQAGRPDAAEKPLREAARIRRKIFPADHWKIADAQSMLGAALLRQGKSDQAEPLLRSGYQSLLATRGKNEQYTLRAKSRLTEWEQAQPGKAATDKG